MIEITDQAILYIGIVMYIVFTIATVLEFKKMASQSKKKKAEKKTFNEEKQLPQLKVVNY